MEKSKCPCCGQMTLDPPLEGEICRECKWEYDIGAVRRPQKPSGCNNMLTLEQGRAIWASGRKIFDNGEYATP